MLGYESIGSYIINIWDSGLAEKSMEADYSWLKRILRKKTRGAVHNKRHLSAGYVSARYCHRVLNVCPPHYNYTCLLVVERANSAECKWWRAISAI